MTISAAELSVSLATFAEDGRDGWEKLLRDAAILDGGGVDRLVVSDHVVFGEHLEEYARPELGGQAGGRQPTGPDGHWLEPLTTLSVIAGRTTRVRLGTNILLAALRRPVVLAKALATLDVLSGGRVDLGVGVGWQRAEYEAAGLAFEDRGRLLDHTLEVCRCLWTEERATYRADELAFDAIHMMPKPLQPGGVPIWVSGTVNRRVVSRLARFGTGWIPWGNAAADVEDGIKAMRQALESFHRDVAGLQIVGSVAVQRDSGGAVDVGRTLAVVPALVDAGVTDVRLGMRLPASDAEAVDLVGTVVTEFRRVTAGAERSSLA